MPAAYRASRRFTVRNSRFLFNARQGLSVIQLRDGTFDGCDFSYTGYVDAESNTGPYGHHSPSAGVDIEPNATPYTGRPVDVLTGNVTLRNCRMIGNLGGALLAAQVHGAQATIENVIVEACTMQASAASPSRYGLIFDVPGGVITGCTLEMADKTAFLGWYPQSSASPTFSGTPFRAAAVPSSWCAGPAARRLSRVTASSLPRACCEDQMRRSSSRSAIRARACGIISSSLSEARPPVTC